MNSIRARLTLTLTAALALLLGIGGVFLYAQTRSGLEQHERRSGLRVIVAGDALDLDASLAILRNTLLVVFAASALAGFFVVTFALRRGLAPLERMAEQVRTIDVGSLSTRFGRDEMPCEL